HDRHPQLPRRCRLSRSEGQRGGAAIPGRASVARERAREDASADDRPAAVQLPDPDRGDAGDGRRQLRDGGEVKNGPRISYADCHARVYADKTKTSNCLIRVDPRMAIRVAQLRGPLFDRYRSMNKHTFLFAFLVLFLSVAPTHAAEPEPRFAQRW